MTDAIAAMRCWVSPRPAISLASRSGIIWAADSRWRGTSWFSHSITISGGDSARPDQQVRPGFAPLTSNYANPLIFWQKRQLKTPRKWGRQGSIWANPRIGWGTWIRTKDARVRAG